MLEIRIPITLGTIGTIKRELAKTIGDVKCSHRIEYRPRGAEAQRRAWVEEQRRYPNRFWRR